MPHARILGVGAHTPRHTPLRESGTCGACRRVCLYRVAGGAHDSYNQVYRTARRWALSCALSALFCDEKFSFFFFGSVKIFFCAALTEANFSPLYSIIRSARLCLLSLLGAAGAAFSILRAAALSPSEPFTHMLTRAPSSACGGHRPGAGGPRRTERHRGGRRSVTTSASAGQYDSGMLFTAASRAPLRRVLRPQRCRARPYTARVALHVLTRGCRAHSFIASARQAAYSETCSRAR